MSSEPVRIKEKKFPWITPRPGRVLVLIDPFEYKGRIVIPDRAQAPPTTGEIVSIGEGVTDLEVGMKVVFGTYSGTLLRFKNQPRLRVLVPDEILCLLHRKDIELEDTGA